MCLKDELLKLDVDELLKLIPTTVGSERPMFYPFRDGRGYSCDCAFGHFQNYTFKYLLVDIIMYIDKHSEKILDEYRVHHENLSYSLVSIYLAGRSALELPHEKIKRELETKKE